MSAARFPTAQSRIAFAVDAASTAEATPLLDQLAPHIGVVKIGLELFTREGPSAVAWAERTGLDVFVDLKLHDIPETVERAVASVASMGARYLTVHAQGGSAMLERAVQRAEREGTGLTILAVTVLTSLDATDLIATGIESPTEAQVKRLAQLAWKCGVRGLVSSAAEASMLRQLLGPDLLLVTPGIRLSSDDRGDQKRVMTPEAARRAGADILVLGRPLRDAADPVAAARRVASELASAGET